MTTKEEIAQQAGTQPVPTRAGAYAAGMATMELVFVEPADLLWTVQGRMAAL